MRFLGCLLIFASTSVFAQSDNIFRENILRPAGELDKSVLERVSKAHNRESYTSIPSILGIPSIDLELPKKQYEDLNPFSEEKLSFDVPRRILLMTALAKNGYLNLAGRELGFLVNDLASVSVRLEKFYGSGAYSSRHRDYFEEYYLDLAQASFKYALKTIPFGSQPERKRLQNFMEQIAGDIEMVRRNIQKSQGPRPYDTAIFGRTLFYMVYYSLGVVLYFGLTLAEPDLSEIVDQLNLPLTIHIIPLLNEIIRRVRPYLRVRRLAARTELEFIGRACNKALSGSQ